MRDVADDLGALPVCQACERRTLLDLSWITSLFLIALICTTGRLIPASASTNQEPAKCDFIPLLCKRACDDQRVLNSRYGNYPECNEVRDEL